MERLTIDEVIEDYMYDAEQNRVDLDISYAERNEQIAEWLKELKAYRDAKEQGLLAIGDDIREIAVTERRKAIDDFKAEAMKQFTEFDLKHGYPTNADCKIILRDVAEVCRGERKE